MKLMKRIRLKPMLNKPSTSTTMANEKINPIRKPDLLGFRKILESKDPLRSVSAFFKFEDIAVSKERDQLVFEDALNLIKLLADRHSPKIADIQQILTIMKQLNLPRNTEIYNAYLKVLVKNNDFTASRQVMYEMKMDGFELNSDSYVAIIQAFESERHFQGILDFIESMKQEGLFVNEEIYRHLLNVALKDTHDFRNFEYVLNIVNDLGYQDHPRIVDVILKHTILKDGIPTAEKMVSKLLESDSYDNESKSRLVCTLMKGYQAQKEYEKVLEYLILMEEKGTVEKLNFIDITCHKMIYHIHMDCLFHLKRSDEALRVFEEMKKKGIEPDQFTYLSLISGFCFNDDLEKAVEIFNEFHKLELPRLGPIYRTLLKAHCEKKLVSETIALFNFMLKNKIFISESIYNIIFGLALKNLDLEMMKNYWNLMTVEKAGMKADAEEDPYAPKKHVPSAESFSLYIELFLKCHRLDEANAKCEEMIEADRQPDATVLGSLLESNILARNFSGAAKAIQFMRKFSLHTSTLSGQIREYIQGRASEFELIIHDLYQPMADDNSKSENIVQSLESNSKRELVLHIYQELQVFGMPISEKTSQLIMNIYNDQKDFVNVVKVWTHFIESKQIPSTETINILLRSAKKYGRQRTIAALISFLEKEHKFSLNVESFKLLLSMAASFGMTSEIRCVILELANHDLQLTPGMYNEMENTFRLRPKYWREANSVREFVEEYFPEALVVAEEAEVKKNEKMPEWFNTKTADNQS